ncbi:PLP-dependent aminotransferase family protein [Motiliproteus coralliicola]|uniref:PLP-dependent aminotransferase family protein n=1 Tax=Motiliproteus coralliicola TaxID=2283196 RepID=A0A369W7M4_9GAMM|nr:PLP-dependent aminotransferase family protein [Motiliproteus coralliicola]RDE18008.1 PLP-dependent aminotransferase family protein [Motiliproteus coralliicola]
MSALFHLDRDQNAGTLQKQIREQLVKAILDGYLPIDEPLPSSRSLAKSLNVARNTIVLVYDELTADGYLIAKERSGYFVDPTILKGKLGSSASSPCGAPTQDSSQVDWSRKLKVQIGNQPNPTKAHTWHSYPYPFVYGQLDSELFPIDSWRKCWRDAASVQAIRDWSSDRYDSDDPMLIEQIQKRILPNRGIQALKDEILITIGSQHSLYLLAQLLLDSRSCFGIEDPGYVSAGHIGRVFGATIQSLPVDDQGLIIGDHLDACDAMYITPSYQCPTTATMPLERRKALLEKAKQQDFVIIEDDYEMEINYDANPTPALKSLDHSGRVLYIGSLSKTLAPGLRMGFMVGPKALIQAARNLRQLMLRHPPLNNQRAVALFLAQGYHDALLRKLVRNFQERSQIMADALDKYLPGSYQRPSGGSSYWCRLPESIDTVLLKQRAEQKGLLIIAGESYCYSDRLPTNFIKLGFSAIHPDAIEPGIKLLAELIEQMRPH